MENWKKLPDRIYRYRDSSVRTLEALVSDHLHYAAPNTFNDPLESRPSLEIDLDNSLLKKIYKTLVEKRISEEMRAAEKKMSAEFPDAIDHDEHSRRIDASSLIAALEYRAEYSDYDFEEYERHLLQSNIEEELLRQYEKGIVCFAQRDDCPLMWSHYGDQHRGICIGYSIPARARGEIHKVDYSSGRLIQASKVDAMLDEDQVAQREVDEAVLLRKAENWNYEQEWRLIGRQGLQNSLLELEEVIFGLKCTAATKFIVMQALSKRKRSAKFFEMREKSGVFDLSKNPLNYDHEMFTHFPVRYLSKLEAFASVKLPRSKRSKQ